MKKLLATLLAALSINAIALDAVTLVTPSPLGVVIAVHSYIKDQKKVYYIRVEAQAQDFEKAKKQAFRLASEQVAGTVVLSESELRNTNLTRDEIITYSSGLIDEYKIINRIDDPGYVKLTMDVWITESVMAQRLLAKSAKDQTINGDALATRVDSILDERQRGDNIINAVLRDLPRRGFKVHLASAQVKMDYNRNTFVTLPVEITWDQRYVNAFTAAAKEVGQKQDPLCWSSCPKNPYYLNGYVFDNDPTKLMMVVDYIKDVRPTLKVELQDLNGAPVSRVCILLPLMHEDVSGGRTMMVVKQNIVWLGADASIRANVDFHLGKNTAAMTNLTEFRAEVVPQAQCRNL